MFGRLSLYWNMLTTDPVGFVIYMLYFAAAILMALILHEVSHGYVALRCGDPTAKMLGRLSLDPRKHLDPLGTVCMLLFGFGWAKPVPVNPRNFGSNRRGMYTGADWRRDDFLVSIAGICMNLTLFILFTALSVGLNRLIWTEDTLYQMKIFYGGYGRLVNPYEYGYAGVIMSGSWSVLSPYMARPFLCWIQRFVLLSAQINLALAIFNLLPIPPLDGYHLVNDTLLKGRLQLNPQTFRIVQFALIAVCFSGALTSFLSNVNSAVYSAVVNLFLRVTGGLA